MQVVFRKQHTLPDADPDDPDFRSMSTFIAKVFDMQFLIIQDGKYVMHSKGFFTKNGEIFEMHGYRAPGLYRSDESHVETHLSYVCKFLRDTFGIESTYRVVDEFDELLETWLD